MTRIASLNNALIASASALALMPAVAHARTTGTASSDSTAAATGDSASPAATTPAPDTSGQAQALQDIVVTAERQSVKLQDAPLAASVISSDTLKQGNINDITDLNGSVPGLVVARSGGAERIITIRGIGSETPENTNTQPGVSYHVDGVYIFNSIAANAAFIDVGQVEVLRGPQGTMFGQGSTGGTINVVTNQPKLDTVAGSADFGFGNYNLVKSDAAINLPIGHTLALRVAGQHYSHDGYAEATGVAGDPHYQLDDANENGWKAALLWQPTDRLSVTLNTIQYDSNDHGPAQKNILDPNPDPRELTQDYPAKSKIKTQLYYGIVSYKLPWATIKSITSYQKLHSDQSWDADGLTADLFYDLTYSPLTYGGYTYDHVALWRSDTKSYTQEINMSGDTGRLQWIVGGVYLHSKNGQYINEFKGSDDDLVQPPLPVDTPYDDPEVAKLTYAELSSITRKAWAAYFQATYDLTPKLSIIAGARYNHDQFSGTSGTNNSGVTSGNYLQPKPTEGLHTNEVTGKAALQYKLEPDKMIYLSYTRGFKPGGINASSAAGGSYSIKPTYQPETVDAIELGSKNRFGRSLQLNFDGFFYFYHDMEFLEADPILYGDGVSNAPEAHIYGIEAETSWIPSSHFRVDASASALHGTFVGDYDALDPAAANAAQIAAGYPGYLFYTNFAAAVAARNAARRDIKGNDVPKLPNVEGSISGTYTTSIAGGDFLAKAEFIHRGKFSYRLFNNSEYDTVPSYNQVNLFFRYQLPESPVHLSLTLTNLFNKAGINSRVSDPYGSAQTFDTYIAPRQVIGSIGFSF